LSPSRFALRERTARNHSTLQGFKEEIASMNQQSEAILDLQPVSFRYKQAFDATKAAQFGLIAEEVV
jgi:hypothetical protein